MVSSDQGNNAARRPVRMAVLLAALGVAACFAAAFTFVAEEPAQAGPAEVATAR